MHLLIYLWLNYVLHIMTYFWLLSISVAFLNNKFYWCLGKYFSKYNGVVVVKFDIDLNDLIRIFCCRWVIRKGYLLPVVIVCRLLKRQLNHHITSTIHSLLSPKSFTGTATTPRFLYEFYHLNLCQIIIRKKAGQHQSGPINYPC